MPTPRTSIDELPTKVTPESDDLLIIQDSGVTKSTTVGGLSSLPSAALTTHINNPTDAHDASAVSAVDAGNGVNGANVQAQLGQLSTLAKGGNDAAAAADAKIVAHMADALDAHDASAISAIAGAILTGVDVQAQLAQIETVLSQGTVGPEGPQGPVGPGVPTGGTAGQLLSKVNSTDFLTQWENPLWLPLAGGTVTGATIFQGPFTVQRVGDDMSINFSKMDATSLAYLRAQTTQFDISTTTPLMRCIVAGVSELEISPTQVRIPSNELIAGVIRSTDLINSGNITNSSGSITNTGTLTNNGVIVADGSPGLRVKRTGAPLRPFIDFYNVGTQLGNIVCADTGFEIVSVSGGISLRPNSLAQKFELDDTGTYAFFGKGASNLAANGVEVIIGGVSDGSIRSTLTAVTMNYYGAHIGAADVNGSNFCQWTRSGSVVGNISQNGTTGTNYGTTSDERLKTFTRDVDDEEALQKVRDMHPLHFTWNHAPEEGEQIGFFAQQLYEIAPEAVTVGSGEPGDEPDPETNMGGFQPWGTDVGKLVPRLVAAMQALDHKIVAMRTEITNLRAEVTDLRGRVKPAH